MDSHKKSWKEKKMLLLEIALILLLAVLSLPVLLTMMGGTNSITGSVISVGGSGLGESLELPAENVSQDAFTTPANNTEKVNAGDVLIELPLELPSENVSIPSPEESGNDSSSTPDSPSGGVIAIPLPEEVNATPVETIPEDDVEENPPLNQTIPLPPQNGSVITPSPEKTNQTFPKTIPPIPNQTVLPPFFGPFRPNTTDSNSSATPSAATIGTSDINIQVQGTTFSPPTPANASTQSNLDIFVNFSTRDNESHHYSVLKFDGDITFWMRMDDVNGSSDPQDTSGNTRHGDYVGGTFINSTGRFGNASHFDGNGDNININGTTNSLAHFINGSRPFTISAWVRLSNTTNRPGSTDEFPGVVRLETNQSTVFAVVFSRLGGYEGLNFGSQTGFIGRRTSENLTRSFFSEEWFHIAIAYGGGDIATGGSYTLYINGTSHPHVNNDGFGAPDRGSRIGIGDSDTLSSFNGSIDEVIIFRRNLSATEIGALYNASAVQFQQNFTGLSAGNHTFIGYGINGSGNISDTGERIVTISNASLCGILVSDTTLINDVTSTGTCFYAGASHITLDCNGFNITWTTNNSAGQFGIDINSTSNNVTVRDCEMVRGSTSGSSQQGIRVSNSYGHRFVNNTVNVRAGGITATPAITLSSSQNNTVENNTIYASSSSGHGIQLSGGNSHGNLIRYNNITATGNSGHGIFITGGNNDNNYIEGNTISTVDGNAINLADANQTYIINNNLSSVREIEIWDDTPSSDLNFLIYNDSFVDLRWTNNGSGNFYENLTLNASYGIGLGLNLFFANNTFALNTTDFVVPSRWSRINSSANITFKGLAFNPINILRRVDNFTTSADQIADAGYNCSSTAGITCRIQSYANGILQFNTTGFSSFTANMTGAQSCGTLTSDTTLTQDVLSPGTCFYIGASHITLDCKGFNITYATNNSNSQDGINLVSTGSLINNVTIKNCEINDITNGGSAQPAIRVDNSNNNTFINNTIITLSTTSRPIQFDNSSDNWVENNSIRSQGTSSFGILISTRSHRNLVRYNNVSTRGTNGYGIYLSSADNDFNYLEGNKVDVVDANAIRIDDGNYTFIINNNLSAIRQIEIWDDTPIGDSNFLIYNDSFVDLRWWNNKTGSYYQNLTMNSSIGLGLNLFFANNTFALNITETFINNFGTKTKFNSSANITFKGLAFSTINILRRVDNFTIVADDIFNAGYNCSSTVGVLCQIQSYSGGILQFNTTGFSSFTSSQAVDTIACGTLVSDTTLTNDVTSAGTCFYAGASHITLDCNGFNITYSTNNSDDQFGILINSTSSNITVRDCEIMRGSTSGSNQHSIAINSSNGHFLVNNTINTRAGGATSSRGIVIGTSDNTTIENNSIHTASSSGYGIHVSSSSDGNLIRKNNITTNGTGAHGIYIVTSTNNNNYLDGNTIGTVDGSALTLDNANYTFIINNNLSSVREFEIIDATSSGNLNFLIYNDSFVDLRWANNGSGNFYENITLNSSNGIGLGLGLFFANNTFAFNITEFQFPARSSKINSSANITFRGLAFPTVNVIYRVDNFTTDNTVIAGVGYNCSSSGGLPCRTQSYSSGILQFNTTGFSSFTANFSDVAAGVTQLVSISFVAPTPANASTQTADFIYVNVTANDTTSDDLFTLVDFDRDLQLWLRFDDVNGSGDPIDYSSFKYNASLLNSADINNSGRWGNASHFDGNGGSLSLVNKSNNTNNLNFGANVGFTISFWVNGDQNATTRRLFNKGGTSGYNLLYSSIALTRFRVTEGGVNINVNFVGNTMDRTWHHLAMGRNSTDAYFYFDGVANVTAADTSLADLTAATGLEIGGEMADATITLNGSIDEFMVWNRSLDYLEIKSLFNATVTKYQRNITNLSFEVHNFTAYAVSNNGTNASAFRSITLQAAAASFSGSEYNVTLNWSSYIGGSGQDSFREVIVLNDGSILSVGNFNLTNQTTILTNATFFGPTENNSVLVTKWRSNGSVIWQTLIGGTGSERGYGMDTDAEGNIYVAGQTNSSDFPTTAGVINETRLDGGGCLGSGHGCNLNAYVFKLNPHGNVLNYSTYIGGTGTDGARGGLAVSPDGFAYILGFTSSTDLPRPINAYQGGFNDAFVTKINKNATRVEWSRYFGASNDTSAQAEVTVGGKVDSQGDIYLHILVGDNGVNTTSTYAVNKSFYSGGNRDQFFVKLSSNGLTQYYATYSGGSGGDFGEHRIAIDKEGNAYFAAESDSTNYPLTPNANQTTNHGSGDCVLVRLNSTGWPTYSTYIGGTLNEVCTGPAVLFDGTMMTAGQTASTDLPVLRPLNSSSNGGTDLYVAVWNVTGSLMFSTYFGGTGSDQGRFMSINPFNGDILAITDSDSTDFPTTPGVYDTTFDGVEDGTLTVFSNKMFADREGTAPVVTLVTPENRTTISRVDYFNINLTSNEVGSNITLNDSRWTLSQVSNGNSFGFANNTVIGEGRQDIKVYANDSFGNNGSINIQFFKDTVAPNTTIIFPLNGSTVTDTEHSNINMTSNEAVNITLNDTRWTLIQARESISFNFTNNTALADGAYHLKAYVNDSGNNNGSINFNFVRSTAANTRPTAPVLIFPANATSIVNRTPLLMWNNSNDSDGDRFSYHLQIDTSPAFSNPVVNVSSIDNTSNGSTSYQVTTELSVDTQYFWRVRANDSGGFGEFSVFRAFTIDSFLSISLLTSTVDFGSLTVGTEDNTTDRVPPPFRIENGGNIFMNISINATALFTTVTHPSTNYQFKITENSSETGSFDARSNTSYINMPAVNTSYHVVELNWRNVNDECLVDINITVPTAEPSGALSSTVTFSASGSSLS